MTSKAKIRILLTFLILVPAIFYGQVRLPKLISDGMVLQRDINLDIWGWASSGEKISISWVSVNPKDVLSFAAVGYFFAKELYDTYKVPIGLINSSVGGSSAEAWISQEAIKSSYPKYYEVVLKYRMPGYLDRINKQDNERIGNWNRQLRQDDEGYKNPDMKWFDPDLNTSDWGKMRVPGHWEDTKTGLINGVVWFRREFDLPASITGKQAVLQLGRIVDADSVYINGKFVGSVGSQYSQRNYRIPDNLLKTGSLPTKSRPDCSTV